MSTNPATTSDVASAVQTATGVPTNTDPGIAVEGLPQGIDSAMLQPVNRADGIKSDMGMPDLQTTLEKLSYNPDVVKSKYDRAVKATVDFLNGKSGSGSTDTSGTGSGGGGGGDSVTSGDKQYGTGPATAGTGHDWTKGVATTFGGPSDTGVYNSTMSFGGTKTCKDYDDANVFYYALNPEHYKDPSFESPNPNTPKKMLDAVKSGKLKHKGKLIFRYKDKTAVGVWLDVGPGAKGNGRYIDLGQPLADYLGVSGMATIEWDFFSKGDSSKGSGGGKGEISIYAFGYDYHSTPPGGAWKVMDVRDIPTPNMSESTNGLSADIRTKVMSYQKAKDHLKTLESWEPNLKAGYQIDIGCSRGHHRSVTLAYLYAQFLVAKGWTVTCHYIDINVTKTYGSSNNDGGGSGWVTSGIKWAKKWVGTSGYSMHSSSRFGEGVGRADCSAYCNAAYHHGSSKYIAGADSYTGSQMEWFKNKKLWLSGSSSWQQAQPGDFIYYQPHNGTGHVALYIGNGKVYSNGGDPIAERRANYRSVLGVGQASKL